MLYDVLRRPQSAFLLITPPQRIVRPGRAPLCHENRYLRAQLRQLKGTCGLLISHVMIARNVANPHAITVIIAPAVAPAAPKHAMVENVGRAPGVLAITSGELPVALRIQSS